MKKIERGPKGPEKQKVENLSQLRDFLEQEFGDMSYRLFLHPFLRQASGYKESSLFDIDPEKKRELEGMALEKAKVTPEVIEKLNKIIKARVEILENDLKNADRLKLKENIRQEAEEILDKFRNKEIIMDEDGVFTLVLP